MSRTDPPARTEQAPDADGLLRAFVEQPVTPLAAAEASRLREQVTRALEGHRARSDQARRRSERWRPWLLFAAAACLPVVVWVCASRFHTGAARRVDAMIVTPLAGSAEIARGDVEHSIAGTVDAALGAGDELRTGEDTSVRASLPTGAVVDVGPWARLRFAATGAGGAVRDRLELVAGRIDVRVPKLRPGDEVRVETADATVIVHGTRFSVERVAAVGAQQSGTRVRVIEGVVTVDTPRGQRTLTAGMELMTPGPLTQDALPSPEAAAASATSASAATSASTAMSAPEGPPAAAGSGPPSTLGAENALLAEAMRLRRERRESRALALIDVFLARYPGSPLTETARVERLRGLEETGATDRLAREAERYLTDYPRGFARQEARRMVLSARAPAP